MSGFMRKIPFKNWFIAHPSITGSLIGLLTGFLLGVLNVPGSVFLVAPLLAGFLAGYLGGSGTKAGLLTLVLPLIVMIAIPLAFPNVDWAASTMPEVEGIGPINATMAALTNGLIRSTWGIAHGLAAVSSAISGIITLIILIMIPILIAFGLALTAVLGFIGGKIGSVAKAFTASRTVATLTHQNQVPLKPASSPTSKICATCGHATNLVEARYCPNCGPPKTHMGKPSSYRA
jgi:hypothetical protein